MSAVATRYAGALYELAEPKNQLDDTAKSLKAVKTLLGESVDLRRLVGSPIIGRDKQAKVMTTVLAKAGVTDLVSRFVAVIAKNGRLAALGEIADAFLRLLAARRGEVPVEVRKQRALLRKIENNYGLRLGHVQSHYLPANWMNRRQFLDDFGGLRVYLVDPYDIFVSKFSSKKEKHKDDLRVLALKLDKGTAKQRMMGDGRAFLEDPHQRPHIEANWQFIYQAALFSESAGEERKQSPRRPSKRGKKRGREEGKE